MHTTAPNPERAIAVDDVTLNGFLDIPPDAIGLVVFAHGSGSSRFSKRNNAVAAFLREAKLGTLLFDLLTPDEERVDVITREHRFDIPLLAERLAGAVRWARQQPESKALRVGLSGSSTGAAAALIAGGEDYVVLELNRDAADRMTCEPELALVSNATQLFEEPGALEEVSTSTRDWFVNHLQ